MSIIDSILMFGDAAFQKISETGSLSHLFEHP